MPTINAEITSTTISIAWVIFVVLETKEYLCKIRLQVLNVCFSVLHAVLIFLHLKKNHCACCKLFFAAHVFYIRNSINRRSYCVHLSLVTRIRILFPVYIARYLVLSMTRNLVSVQKLNVHPCWVHHLLF